MHELKKVIGFACLNNDLYGEHKGAKRGRHMARKCRPVNNVMIGPQTQNTIDQSVIHVKN